MTVSFSPEHAKVAARLRKPSANRSGRYLAIVLGSGALAALIAIVIAAIPTVLSFDFPRDGGPQIMANQAFPSAQPTHQVVNVYDPPTYAPRPRPTAEPTEPAETTTASPEPRESPEPGDN